MAIFKTHKVTGNDTVYSICNEYQISQEQLRRLNGIGSNNVIHHEQVLKIEAVTEFLHKVEAGQTIYAIGRLYDVSPSSIIATNGIKNPKTIKAGDEFIIPGARSGNPPGGGDGQSSNGLLGALSQRYEVGSGGPGTISGGEGDPGGKSYGSYQLASSLGNVDEFIDSPAAIAWKDDFDEHAVGTKAFDKIWEKIAEETPSSFHAAQHEYIKKTHFDPLVKNIQKKADIDILDRSRALQEVIWSTAVHHGPNSSIAIDALKKANEHSKIHHIDSASSSDSTKELDQIEAGVCYDEDAITTIYAERGRVEDGIPIHFKNASEDLYPGLIKRFQNERADALEMLKAEKALHSCNPLTDMTTEESRQLLAKAQNRLTDNEVRMMVEHFADNRALNHFDDGGKVLFGLRKSTNYMKGKKGEKGIYDDPFILVWRMKNGGVRLKRFMGNTDPSGRYIGRFGNDMDGDGKLEVGRLCAGTYHYNRFTPTNSARGWGKYAFRADKVQAAIRDLDHDGNFDLEDGDVLDEAGAGRSMLIHKGGWTRTNSAGCQTMHPRQYSQFLATLDGTKRFPYVLINLDGRPFRK